MKPKIYAFGVPSSSGLVNAYALAEDGKVLAMHGCTDESCVPGDLGVTRGLGTDNHVRYEHHYPDGYEMEFVPMGDIEGHAGVQEALRRNRSGAA